MRTLHVVRLTGVLCAFSLLVAQAELPDSCSHEKVTCQPGSTFPRELCQPYMTGSNTVASICGAHDADNRYILPDGTSGFFSGYCPPLGNDERWDTEPSYMLRCACPEERYGHDCGLVKPMRCPNEKDWIWDGSFRNTLTPEKQYECFLKPLAEQPAGLAKTVTSSLRHSRVNLTISNNTNAKGTTDITVKFFSRFRPHNLPKLERGCPTWIKSYLPQPAACGNPRWYPGCRDPTLPDPLRSIQGSPGHVYTGPPSGGNGNECCEDSVNWLTCKLMECVADCSVNDQVAYTCPKAQCTYEEPSYLNLKSSTVGSWALLKEITSAKGQTGKFTTTKSNYAGGFSNLSTLEMAFPKYTNLAFTIQCMGGSCINRNDLPKEWNRTLTKSYVDMPLNCTGAEPPPASLV